MPSPYPCPPTKTFSPISSATQLLAQAERAAQGARVQSLSSKPSLEIRRRVEALLHDPDEQRPTPEQLQIERAIAVLERFETIEVRQALRRLAETNAGSELASAAPAAFRRLSR